MSSGRLSRLPGITQRCTSSLREAVAQEVPGGMLFIPTVLARSGPLDRLPGSPASGKRPPPASPARRWGSQTDSGLGNGTCSTCLSAKSWGLRTDRAPRILADAPGRPWVPAHRLEGEEGTWCSLAAAHPTCQREHGPSIRPRARDPGGTREGLSLHLCGAPSVPASGSIRD